MILPRQLKPRDVLQWLVRTPNQGCAHVPEKLTPTPAAASSNPAKAHIYFLAQGLEAMGCLFVGKEVQQPQQFSVGSLFIT